MLDTIIYIAVPLQHDTLVTNTIDDCCARTGDVPIGRRVYADIEEVLIVVRLIRDYHVNEHLPLLSQAFQQRLIISFQIEMTKLVSVESPTSQELCSLMRAFPLHSGDSWFPAIASKQHAYICLRSNQLQPDQQQWLAEHQLTYAQ